MISCLQIKELYSILYIFTECSLALPLIHFPSQILVLPRCVQSLEDAANVLSKEYEDCELVKMDCKALGQPNVDEGSSAALLGPSDMIYLKRFRFFP